MNFEDVNILTWAILFFAYLIFDILYTKYILSISKLKAIQAASLSVLMYVSTVYGTIKYLENLWNLIPILFASWLGTFLILRYEIRLKKRNKKKK
jgi:hypothetical protein